MLTPHFLSRAFTPMLQPALNFQLEPCTYSTLGGPKSARLVARCASMPDLDQLVALLRCPVELYTPAGRLAWWGLAWSVTVQDGALSAQVTLDDLANRVATAYSDLQPTASGAGTRQTTAYLDDLTSQGSYGIKENLLTLAMASQAQAESFRATYLAANSRPTIRNGCGSGRGEALPRPALRAPLGGVGTSGPYGRAIILECRGWWETLSWRHYTAPALTIDNYNLRIAGYNIGKSGSTEMVAQHIVVPPGGWFAGTIWIALRRVIKVPTDNVVVDLCSDSAGVPGATLASASYPGASLQIANPKWVKFVLSPSVLLPAGDYWIKVYDSSASAGTHYRIVLDPTLSYLPGAARHWSGSAWVAMAPDADLQFRFACLIETTEQIRAMATFANQFLHGLRIETASGLYTNPYRSGDTTVLEEITHHLQAGTINGTPLTAEVTPERMLAIKARVDPSGSTLKISRDGIIRLPTGAPATPGPNLAGSWATLDVPWSTSSANWSLTPGKVYLDAVAWDSATDAVRLVPAIS